MRHRNPRAGSTTSLHSWPFLPTRGSSVQPASKYFLASFQLSCAVAAILLVLQIRKYPWSGYGLSNSDATPPSALQVYRDSVSRLDRPGGEPGTGLPYGQSNERSLLTRLCMDLRPRAVGVRPRAVDPRPRRAVDPRPRRRAVDPRPRAVDPRPRRAVDLRLMAVDLRLTAGMFDNYRVRKFIWSKGPAY